MQIGTFRRNVAKTLTVKSTKMALKMVAKNTARTHLAQATVALKGHTGQLLQTMGQYVLGLPQTQEMKNQAFVVLGDVGFDLIAVARVLKVKLPSSTKKSKLVGTRGAALLQLDSLATDLLLQVEQSLFNAPTMSKVKKMVSMPQKGGAKEERTVNVVNQKAEQTVEATRQEAMKSFVAGAVDVYWRLCLDVTGQPPVDVLKAKITRMQKDYPAIAFDMGEKKPVPVGIAKAKAKAAKTKKKAAAEPVPA